jgi:hypothetical protein
VHLSQGLVQSLKEVKDVKINRQVIDNRCLYSVFDDLSLLVWQCFTESFMPCKLLHSMVVYMSK